MASAPHWDPCVMGLKSSSFGYTNSCCLWGSKGVSQVVRVVPDHCLPVWER